MRVICSAEAAYMNFLLVFPGASDVIGRLHSHERARLQLGKPLVAAALPKAVGNWSLTSLQQRLVKTGGRLVKSHARYYWLLLAKSHLARRLFAGMLGKIAALLVPTG
jgi:hypothetical protein